MNLSEDREEENSTSETRFSEQTEEPGTDVYQMPRAASPHLSNVSIKSEESFKFLTPHFSDGSMTSELR